MSVNYPISNPYTGAGMCRCQAVINERYGYVSSLSPEDRADALCLIRMELSAENNCNCCDSEIVSIRKILTDFFRGFFK